MKVKMEIREMYVQGMPKIARKSSDSRKETEDIFSSQPSEGNNPANSLISDLKTPEFYNTFLLFKLSSMWFCYSSPRELIRSDSFYHHILKLLFLIKLSKIARLVQECS